jgi:peptide/nickel transport system substrate-binding protein
LGVLNVAQIGNPVSLTCSERSATDEYDIITHIMDPIFRFNQDAQLESIVAESFELVSPAEWIIHLRPGMAFHDPKYDELTAEDVLASINACYREDGKRIIQVPASITQREVEILDDYTLKVTLGDAGTAALPNYFTDIAVTSKEYLEEIELNPDLERHPVGTGPLVFDEWVPNVGITADRFENYWGEDIAMDRVAWKIITDPFTRKSELLTGGIDILPFVIPDWVDEIEGAPNVRIESTVSSRYVFIGLPSREPPYDNGKVRQALNYAVNKDELIGQLFGGRGAVPVTGIVHPILPEADPSGDIYGYNPDLARQLLDEARAEGVSVDQITLYSPNDRYTLDKQTGEAVAGYWRDIGLNVKYVPQSRTVLFPVIQYLEATDPFLFGNGNGRLRAEYPFELWTQKREEPRSRGMQYAAGPDLWDEEINNLSLTLSGSPEAIEQARAINRKVVEFAPWVFLFNYVDFYGVSNRIDWQPYPTEQRLLHTVRLRQ